MKRQRRSFAIILSGPFWTSSTLLQSRWCQPILLPCSLIELWVSLISRYWQYHIPSLFLSLGYHKAFSIVPSGIAPALELCLFSHFCTSSSYTLLHWLWFSHWKGLSVDTTPPTATREVEGLFSCNNINITWLRNII